MNTQAEQGPIFGQVPGNLPSGCRLDEAREADTRWRRERSERHAEHVRRLRRGIKQVERGTVRMMLVCFLISLCVLIGSLAFQNWYGDPRRPSVFRYEVAIGIVSTVAVTLIGAFWEALLRRHLRKVMEQGWRDGIEFGD